MINVLLKLAAARLLKKNYGWLTLTGWASFSLASAWYSTHWNSSPAVERALVAGYATLAVPFLEWEMTKAILVEKNVMQAAHTITCWGLIPLEAYFYHLCLLFGASSLVCGGLGALTCYVAHGLSTSPLGDMLTTARVGALAGASYAAYFLIGSTGKRPALGQTLLLFIDWFLPSTTGLRAAITPRAHFHNLLGVPPLSFCSQPASTVVLTLWIGGGTLFTLLRFCCSRSSNATRTD
ncbi:hypothetical protein [Pajaroellobacter abortibovis]|nr:hypothetical protein [Pajaroellobacter abortibovis]